MKVAATKKIPGPREDWRDLGDYEDDPDISQIFHDLEEAKKAIFKKGFGKTSGGNPIKKNKESVGFKRWYTCDNFNNQEIKCQKRLRIEHYFNHRNAENKKIFKL